MPDADFFIAQGDTASSLSDTLKDASGNAVDLQSATVTVTITPIGGGTAIVNAAAASNDQVGDGSDGSKGDVSYAWQSGDTDTAGYYLARWTVTFQDGSIQSYPNDGFLLIAISEDAPTGDGQLYVQVEEMKAALELSDTSFADEDISRSLNAACRAIDLLTDRFFYKTSSQTRYFEQDWRLDWVGITDLVTLTSVAVDTSGDGTFDTTWTQDTDFYLEPYNAALENKPYDKLRLISGAGRSFPIHRRSIEVVGVFGWPAIPANVSQYALILANKLLMRTREAPFGVIMTVDLAARIARNDPDFEALVGGYIKAGLIL